MFSLTGSKLNVNAVVLPSPSKVSTKCVFPVTTPPIVYAITFVPFAGAVSKVRVVLLTLKESLF